MISLEALRQRMAESLPDGHNKPKPICRPLLDSVGMILAEPIVSPLNLPRHDVSAMDGYALASGADLAEGGVFTVVGESIAGCPYSGPPLQPQQCIRIMTGACVPSGVSTVVMQENTTAQPQQQITLNQAARPVENIRFSGEELAKGDRLFAAGQRITPADVVLLASVGLAQITVCRPLSVALLTSGDELTELGQPLNDNGIYDCNRPGLLALLADLPVEVHDIGRVADRLDAIETALAQAAEVCDVVITTGGVSVGDYDHLKEAVQNLGKIEQHKVAMKPGKPFVFGYVGNAVYFGLPGNPLSTVIGFEQLVKPQLLLMGGMQQNLPKLQLQATLTAAVKKRPGRADFQRGIAQLSDEGWQVAPLAQQDSHRVKGLSQANCWLLLEAEDGPKAAGEMVQIQPLKWCFS